MGKLLKLLSQNGFLVLNKSIVKEKGFEFTSVLSVFCRLQEEYENTELYKENDGFFQTLEKLQDEAIVCKPTLLKVIKELKELNILTITKKGTPCRNYYKLNEDHLEIYMVQLLENEQQVGKPIDQLVGKPINQLDGKPINQLYINNTNINKNIEIIENNNIDDTNQTTIKRELNKDETKHLNSIKKIIDMFNQCCNKQYSYNNKSYNKCIIARLKEGATFEMFCKVTMVWYLKWKDTEFKPYIKPDTLFNEKFWSRAESEIPDGIISEIKSKYGLDLRPKKEEQKEKEEFIC